MELRQAFGENEDVVIVYVLPDTQVNAKTLRFLDETGVRRRVQVAVDPGSRAIDRLGIRLPDPEPIEVGVPHPTTLLLDRGGRVRLVDVRSDYHLWLAPELLREALGAVP
ncbi:MAG: hypothetical protein QNK04_29730 [Myxococcota bacterium]|nr:hypothetical protein [Myxococcota bacterium]